MEERGISFESSKFDLAQWVSPTHNEMAMQADLNALILETFRERFLYSGFMLFFNYAGRGGKYFESALSHARIIRLTGLK